MYGVVVGEGGCVEGVAVAACCPGGGPSGEQLVSAINLFSSPSLQAEKCRQASWVPGMGLYPANPVLCWSLARYGSP